MTISPSTEILSSEECRLVAPFFTNADRSIVALRNLPEVIKGALFSRYSRSSKGVRRLFLDEFLVRDELGLAEFEAAASVPRRDLRAGRERAESFYRRVLSDYGDDSVAELGGAHLACQEISQLAAKAVEDNRLGLSYLEKSSRYVPFDDRVDGRFRYYRPQRILESPHGGAFIAVMDLLFETYTSGLPALIEHLEKKFPIAALEFENALTGETLPYSRIADPDMQRSSSFAYRQALRSRACDMLRGLLPMATLTNVGVWGNGRALEYLLVKLLADPLDETRGIAAAAHEELEPVIGPFLRRANDSKGRVWQAYLRAGREASSALAHKYLHPPDFPAGERIHLVHHDPDALNRVVAAILYPAADLPAAWILSQVRSFDPQIKTEIIREYVGVRRNRRHKPGRAFERAVYEFDLLLNIGEYRDLQRQRIVSPMRQPFTTAHGYDTNPEVDELPMLSSAFHRCMEQAHELFTRLESDLPAEAQYTVPFAFRVRYNVQLNLREAYHWIELRTSPQGHPDYRRTSQEMYWALHRVHPELIEYMWFVDLTPEVPLGRLRAEMRRASKTRP